MAIVCAVVALGSLVLIDALGLLQRRPAADRLVRRFSDAWARLAGYEAQVSVGQEGGASAGPVSCFQWYTRGQGPQAGTLVIATRDVTGFAHVERWRGGEWEYYDPGPELEAKVSVSHLDALPHGRWLLSGFPTLEDLEEALRGARDGQVVGFQDGPRGGAWIVECRPQPPVLGSAVAAWEPAADFYAQRFRRPWRVWFANDTGLPTHVVIAGPPDGPSLRIGIEKLRPGPPPALADWKTAAGGHGQVRQRLQLRGDAASPASLDAARRRIQREANAWRRSLFPRARPAAGQP
jgi:hypothetical protein